MGGGRGVMPVVMMNIFLCTFFQGTDATVGDNFAPLGPPLLPYENCKGRGRSHTNVWKDEIHTVILPI